MNASPLSRFPVADAPRSGDLVTRLQEAAIFRDYRAAFEGATGLPLVLRAAGSFQAPLHGSRVASPFCALMAAQSRTCAACLQTQQRAEDEASASSRTLRCFAGLTDSLVPVQNGEAVI